GGLVIPGTQPIVAKRGEGLGRGVRQLVTRELFENESVERLVLIERLNYIVPITPSIWLGGIPLRAVWPPGSDHIQPVPSPALAIGGPRQKTVDELFELAWIAEKGLLLRERRGEPDQIQIHSPQKSARPGRRSGLPAARLQLRQYKGVDRISHP